MRIRVNDRPNPLRKGENSSSTARTASSGLFSMFSTELQAKKVEADQYEKDINDLRQELDTAGQMLEKEPTLPNFKRFRGLLSDIAKRVSGEAYRLEKIGGTPMNPRYYEIITVIDKEAEKLYQMIVKDQKDRMAITASVIGIKGLVVDLVT